jgi:hypothetical protein
MQRRKQTLGGRIFLDRRGEIRGEALNDPLVQREAPERVDPDPRRGAKRPVGAIPRHRTFALPAHRGRTSLRRAALSLEGVARRRVIRVGQR